MSPASPFSLRNEGGAGVGTAFRCDEGRPLASGVLAKRPEAPGEQDEARGDTADQRHPPVRRRGGEREARDAEQEHNRSGYRDARRLPDEGERDEVEADDECDPGDVRLRGCARDPQDLKPDDQQRQFGNHHPPEPAPIPRTSTGAASRSERPPGPGRNPVARIVEAITTRKQAPASTRSARPTVAESGE